MDYIVVHEVKDTRRSFTALCEKKPNTDTVIWLLNMGLTYRPLRKWIWETQVDPYDFNLTYGTGTSVLTSTWVPKPHEPLLNYYNVGAQCRTQRHPLWGIQKLIDYRNGRPEGHPLKERGIIRIEYTTPQTRH